MTQENPAHYDVSSVLASKVYASCESRDLPCNKEATSHTPSNVLQMTPFPGTPFKDAPDKFNSNGKDLLYVLMTGSASKRLVVKDQAASRDCCPFPEPLHYDFIAFFNPSISISSSWGLRVGCRISQFLRRYTSQDASVPHTLVSVCFSPSLSRSTDGPAREPNQTKAN